MDNLLAIAQYFLLPWTVFVIGAGICGAVATAAAILIHRHAEKKA